MDTKPSSVSLPSLLAWLAVSLLVMLVVPTWIGYGAPVWQAQRAHLGLGLAAVQLGAGLIVVWDALRGRGLSAGRVLGVVGALLAALFLTFLVLDVRGYSRAALLTGTSLVVVLSLLPILWSRNPVGTALLGALAAAAAATVHLAGGPARLVDLIEETSAGGREGPTFVATAYHTLRVDFLDELIPQDEVTGGALTGIGDQRYLVVTGSGRFYGLRGASSADSLRATPLGIRAPLNHQAFAAATGPEVNTHWFRTADVLAGTSGDTVEVLVSHHHWKQEEECFVLRVSRLESARSDLWRPDGEGRPPEWETIYETEPCLPLKDSERGLPFAGLQTGGRLAHLGGDRYLLTVGDLQFDGWNSEVALPQKPSADYGKILVLNVATGQSEVFTSGHRNPQGLEIGPDGTIWSTEHGPDGGDELNVIRRGENYGWPSATFGTEYGMHHWPSTDTTGRDFTGPAFSWGPSVGVSNLIAVRGSLFERWRSHLLIASLAGNRLYRADVREGNVVNLERVEIGGRIRDLVEGDDGRILLLLDRETVVRLSPADLSDDGAAIFASQCSGCHGSDAAGPEDGSGPGLDGVFRRRIGWLEDYDYSEALRSKDGVWTEEKLDRFLADPQEFAPGTTMEWNGLDDPDDRRALIAYLRSL